MRFSPARTRALLLAPLSVAVTGVVAAATMHAPPPTPRAPVAGIVAPVAVTPRVSRARVPAAVAPLSGVVVPDLELILDRPLTARQVVALRRVRGVTAFTVLSTGVVSVGGRSLQAVGVDPSSFRGFSPKATAASDPLWAAVARGELAAAFTAKLPLGRDVVVAARQQRSLRVGAVADFGLPGVDLVLDAQEAARLGLRKTAVLLSAPERSLRRLKKDVRAVIGVAPDLQVLRPMPITYRRPATYRQLYMLSATYCPGLSWKVLAAIGQVESGHGRNVGPSSAGAVGPMQFLPTTWAYAGVDGDGDGKSDIRSAYDAVPAASLYLCRNGAGRGGKALYDAIFSYNHLDSYVQEVLTLAEAYV